MAFKFRIGITFTNKLLNHIKTAALVITMSNKNKSLKKWIISHLTNSIRNETKCALFNITIKEKYNKFSNLNKLLKIAKLNYDLLCKSNNKKIWDCINEMLGINYTTHHTEVDPNVLNKQFSQVGKAFAEKLSNENLNNLLNLATCKKINLALLFYMKPTDSNKNIQIINSLKNNTTSGVDRINNVYKKNNTFYWHTAFYCFNVYNK